MISDMNQAIDRISYLIKNEPDRKVVFLTGSGISVPNIPSVTDTIDIFLKELGSSRSEVFKRISAYSDSERYQAAAQELKQRRGERSLAAAIQKAVLTALHDQSEVEKKKDFSSIEPSRWALPPAQEQLGRLVAKIPMQQRGAIITTNFDPLTEAALELNNVRATTLATPGNQAFPIDSVYGGIPVVHLHGFWATTATLSTSMHLNTERPSIERMIGRILEKSAVIVLGYGGWEDSFTRALVKMITEGYMSSLESELLWLQYGTAESAAGHSLLSQIKGEAGVNLYFGIDANDLLQGVLSELTTLKRTSRKTYPGWDIPSLFLSPPERSEFVAYFNGAYPTMSVAAQVPRLENARLALQETIRLTQVEGDCSLLLSSPAGEGKTTALLQCAHDLLENYPNANLIVRRPGAPLVTAKWIAHLKKEHELTIAFVDDADLVIEEIYEAYRDLESNKDFGKVIWVLATHSSYSNTPVTRRFSDQMNHFVHHDFKPVDMQDIRDLIDLWKTNRFLPPALDNLNKLEIENKIMNASYSLNHHASLFGSLLTFWSGDALRTRIVELLKKLERQQISGIRFRELLAYVAITQHAWHSSGEGNEGLSLVAFGKFANVNDSDVAKILVRPLGREVGLSQIGNKVLVRHPAIAEAIYNIFRESNELNDIVHEISKQGSILRFDSVTVDADSSAAYRLARRLPGEASVRAAIGAVQGAPNMLEPRVTLLATLRGIEDFDRAANYAAGLEAHLLDYEDYQRAARGFYVEWSNIEASEGRLDSALRLAIKSLSDDIDSRLLAKQIEYALTCIKKYAHRLAGTRRSEALELYVSTLEVLSLVPYYRFVGREENLIGDSNTTRILDRFRVAIKPFGGQRTVGLVKMTRLLHNFSIED